MDSTTTAPSAPELRAIWRVGMARACRTTSHPVRSSPDAASASCSTAGMHRSSASPAPGTIPSARAARVALMASSKASLRLFSSASVRAPTRMTATPPESLPSRSSSFSRS